MDWKTWLKEILERHTNIRIYRYSLPRGVDFSYDARHILVPDKVKAVFDVGANIGQSAEQFRKKYPNAKICCFEPVSNTYKHLRRWASGCRQVETHQLALGSACGSGKIYVHSDPTSPVSSFVNALDSDTQEQVQVQTLDNFCIHNSIDYIDLLKIDVEGYELEVLRGAHRMLSEHRIRSLYLETAVRSNQDHYFVPLSQIDEQLAAYNYTLFGIYEQEMDRFRNINYCHFFNAAYVLHTLCVRNNDQ